MTELRIEGMTHATYELRRLLHDGPQPDEGFFRLKATGNGETHWFNVTPDQLEAIAELLNR